MKYNNKWRNVCSSVEEFLKNLTINDLVAGMVFNENIGGILIEKDI